jgi:hypothetical protein
MIEVYQQQLTDELAFKGIMSAFGCGLLLLALFVVVAAGVGDALQLPKANFWRYALAAMLVVFLLLQLVPWTRSK